MGTEGVCIHLSHLLDSTPLSEPQPFIHSFVYLLACGRAFLNCSVLPLTHDLPASDFHVPGLSCHHPGSHFHSLNKVFLAFFCCVVFLTLYKHTISPLNYIVSITSKVFLKTFAYLHWILFVICLPRPPPPARYSRRFYVSFFSKNSYLRSDSCLIQGSMLMNSVKNTKWLFR